MLFRTTRLLVLGLAFAGFGGCNNVGDDICPVGTDFADKTDECPYGPPGGPRVHEAGCPDIPQTPGPACTTTWAQDIWPLLASGPKSCGSGGCHGAGAGGLTLPEGNAAQAFAALKAYAPQVGYPYLSDAAPGHTWILCNLHGDLGGRSKMPPSSADDATYQKVKAWAQCGEPLGTPGGGTTSSTGGTGGAGGGSTAASTGTGGTGGTGGV